MGAEKFGTRTEMKNLNSFSFIMKAIEYEYARQVKLIEEGGEVVQETRRFDESTGKTYSMRRKEDCSDYRYFPDPDLPPIELSEEYIASTAASMPILPDERKRELIEKYALTPYECETLTSDESLCAFYSNAAAKTRYPKLLCAIITSHTDRLLILGADCAARLCDMAGDELINSNTLKKVIASLPEGTDPEKYVKANDLEQISDDETLAGYAKKAIEANPRSVTDYKNGKKAAIKAIVGAVMSASGGKANPRKTEEIIADLINKM